METGSEGRRRRSFTREYKDRQRLHSSLGYLSPAEYEAQKEAQSEAAQAA